MIRWHFQQVFHSENQLFYIYPFPSCKFECRTLGSLMKNTFYNEVSLTTQYLHFNTWVALQVGSSYIFVRKNSKFQVFLLFFIIFQWFCHTVIFEQIDLHIHFSTLCNQQLKPKEENETTITFPLKIRLSFQNHTINFWFSKI